MAPAAKNSSEKRVIKASAYFIRSNISPFLSPFFLSIRLSHLSYPLSLPLMRPRTCATFSVCMFRARSLPVRFFLAINLTRSLPVVTSQGRVARTPRRLRSVRSSCGELRAANWLLASLLPTRGYLKRRAGRRSCSYGPRRPGTSRDSYSQRHPDELYAIIVF